MVTIHENQGQHNSNTHYGNDFGNVQREHPQTAEQEEHKKDPTEKHQEEQGEHRCPQGLFPIKPHTLPSNSRSRLRTSSRSKEEQTRPSSESNAR